MYSGSLIGACSSLVDYVFIIFTALTAWTLKLDDKLTAVKVTDSKLTAREIFLEQDELPKPGGPNPLRDLVDKNYAVEIFYFPASSLEITDLTRCKNGHCYDHYYWNAVMLIRSRYYEQ